MFDTSDLRIDVLPSFGLCSCLGILAAALRIGNTECMHIDIQNALDASCDYAGGLETEVSDACAY
jgi:hypothetical protein